LILSKGTADYKAIKDKISHRGHRGHREKMKKKGKGSHGLHQDSFKLQTMTALIKSFCRGVQGGQFFQKAPPLAAGGRTKR
jgi:hypothetical protein